MARPPRWPRSLHADRLHTRAGRWHDVVLVADLPGPTDLRDPHDRPRAITSAAASCASGTRELLVDGQAQALEPLAFDLLAYLLRHRDRDVSKDELLDEVWLGRIVSVGAVARAAMTVRKAIGCVAAGTDDPNGSPGRLPVRRRGPRNHARRAGPGRRSRPA